MLNADVMSIIATKEPWLLVSMPLVCKTWKEYMKLNGATSKELIAEVKKEYAHGNPFTYFDPNFMCDTTHCTMGKGHLGLCFDLRVDKNGTVYAGNSACHCVN